MPALAGTKGRWAVAAISAAVITATLLLLFRLPPPPKTLPASAAKSAVKLAKPDNADLLLKEEAQLRDLRPLFLPTNRNAALPEPRLEPGRTFLDNERVKLIFPEAELNIAKELPSVVTLNGKPLDQGEPAPRDALAPDAAGPGLLGFGREPIVITPLSARGGFVEVVATRDGRRVLAQPLPVEAGPPTGKSWEPMEFLASVDAAGLASPLVVTESSRVEEVDTHFRNFLARTFRIGERLEPGFYRITVAP